MNELQHNSIKKVLEALGAQTLTSYEWMMQSMSRGILYDDFLVTVQALKEVGIVSATVIGGHITAYRLNK